jgi:hypothetical protein
MRLQVVNLHQWYMQRQSHTLGKTGTYQQTAQQTWTTRKGYGTQLVSLDARTLERGIYNRHNVQLVSAARQLGNHSTKLLMHALRGRDIAQ